MNGDIRPPRRPDRRPAASLPPPVTLSGQPHHQTASQRAVESSPEAKPDLGQLPSPKLKPAASVIKRRRRWPWMVALALLGIVLMTVAAGVWYVGALRPVGPADAETQEVTIASGSTPNMIADQLSQEGLIRSKQAFLIHVRLQGVQGSLREGDYQLTPADSTQAIVEQLTKGQTASKTIMFYPGATLYDPTDTPDAKRTDVYTVLRKAGFNDGEIRAGLEKDYEHPLFAGKPRTASLEGYIFGETYQFDRSASVEQVLMHVFDTFYQRIQTAHILDKLPQYDMTLYQAITLASVIEREVSGQLDDQRIVSQIFHKRLALGEPLGADATFMYVANQRNVTPTITIESPYNTRINKGLPPGPIAAPDMTAMQAAVSPADTDYLFFVSGDDGKNHFARTNTEHLENTRRYCTTLCNDIAN